jgi:outer membrane protein TolC
MLTLIKLIHTLNQRLGRVRTRLDGPIIKFQAICAVLALSLSGVGGIEAANGSTYPRRSLSVQESSISTNDRSIQLPPNSIAKSASTKDDGKLKNNLNAPTPGDKVTTQLPPNSIAKRSSTKDNGKLKNNLNAPTTGDKITTQLSPDSIAQRSSSKEDGKLNNNLNPPTTGDEVRIVNTQPLTLKEAVDIALRNNRDVQAARLAVTRDRAAIREAQAGQSIQVGVTGTLQNQGGPVITGTRIPQNALGDSSSTDLQGNLQATYNILDAGRNGSLIRAAEEQVKFDRLDLVRVEQQVKGNVLTAYYDLQQSDSLTIINQAAVKDATRSLSDAQLQEKAGVGTKFDILRAEVVLASANQDLENSKGQQATARKKLAQLLSASETIEYRAADPVRELGAWGFQLEDSIILAYKNRPELKQQLVRRSIAEQQQVVANAADSPQLNLFANYNLGKSISTSLAAQDSYSLGARLSWTFFDGGAAGARSSQQKVTQEIAENQFTTARNQIRFEVEQAYNTLGTSKKNIATSTQALKQAEESLKLARLRFQAGVGTQTDVIQSQTELARARGNRITAIINYNRSLSSLRTATITIE